MAHLISDGYNNFFCFNCFPLYLYFQLKRDLFIPSEIKPKNKPIDEMSLSYIFSILDEMLEVNKITNFFLFLSQFKNNFLKTATSRTSRKSLHSLQQKIVQKSVLVSL